MQKLSELLSELSAAKAKVAELERQLDEGQYSSIEADETKVNSADHQRFMAKING